MKEKRLNLRSRHSLGVSTIPLVDAVTLHRALDNFYKKNPDLTKIVDLKYSRGLTLKEIAAQTALSITQVLRKLHKADLHFREEMKAYSDTKDHGKSRQFGYAKGEIHMAEDFDEPLEEFREYM
jgi:hypothetical protein